MIYRANKADIAAWERAKPCKLILNKALAKLIAMKLHRSWSPQQIAGWLMRTYPNERSIEKRTSTVLALTAGYETFQTRNLERKRFR